MRAEASNGVRAAREALGVTQLDLAMRVRLSRQALGAIEAGRALPSVDVALRLGSALGASVEALFGTAGDEVDATIAGDACAPGGRVALVQVGGRWVAHALGEDGLRVSADGIVAPQDRNPISIRLARDEAVARENVAVVGCAPALGIIADRLNTRAGPGRCIWFARSSMAALHALASGHAHVAGIHLVDETSGLTNLTDVRRAACGFPVTVVTLARWEAGLVVAPGNPCAIRSVTDLASPALRVVIREAGSGAQRLLDRCLREAGVPHDLGGAIRMRAPGHLEVARAVQIGAADAGIATRDAAIALGLEFIPLAVERFDLAFPSDLRDDRRLARLLDMLVSRACRADLGALGYDVRDTGAHVADVSAA